MEDTRAAMKWVKGGKDDHQIVNDGVEEVRMGELQAMGLSVVYSA